MSDRSFQSVVSGDTPEAVAYALMLGIAEHEGKLSYQLGTPIVKAEREWALQTFVACLRVVKG